MNKAPDEWEIGAHNKIRKEEMNGKNSQNCNRDSAVARVSHPASTTTTDDNRPAIEADRSNKFGLIQEKKK